MGDSNKGIIGLLIGGALYALLKLGDEFIVISDEILTVIDDFPILLTSVDNAGQAVAEMEITIGTLVFGLLAVFLVLAIADYVATEM